MPVGMRRVRRSHQERIASTASQMAKRAASMSLAAAAPATTSATVAVRTRRLSMPRYSYLSISIKQFPSICCKAGGHAVGYAALDSHPDAASPRLAERGRDGSPPAAIEPPSPAAHHSVERPSCSHRAAPAVPRAYRRSGRCRSPIPQPRSRLPPIPSGPVRRDSRARRARGRRTPAARGRSRRRSHPLPSPAARRRRLNLRGPQG